MSDRPNVMTQTKKDTPVLQVGGWALDQQPQPVKTFMPRKLQRCLVLDEGCIAYLGNMRRENSWGNRRMQAPVEGGQGPEGAVAPYKDGCTNHNSVFSEYLPVGCM
jgi:hypothetical protein